MPTRMREVAAATRDDEDLRAGIGKRRDRVVLGEPVAVVAQLLGEARELDGLGDRPRAGLRPLTTGTGRAPPAKFSSAQSEIHITPPTSAAKKSVSQKMPRMRCLSMLVKPSFFFVAKRYSTYIRAKPRAE